MGPEGRRCDPCHSDFTGPSSWERLEIPNLKDGVRLLTGLLALWCNGNTVGFEPTFDSSILSGAA